MGQSCTSLSVQPQTASGVAVAVRIVSFVIRSHELGFGGLSDYYSCKAIRDVVAGAA